MRIPLIKIGNSHGIRIPAGLIKECAFSKEVELCVKNQTLILSSPKEGRQNWEEALKKEAQQKPFQNNEEEWL